MGSNLWGRTKIFHHNYLISALTFRDGVYSGLKCHFCTETQLLGYVAESGITSHPNPNRYGLVLTSIAAAQSALLRGGPSVRYLQQY